MRPLFQVVQPESVMAFFEDNNAVVVIWLEPPLTVRTLVDTADEPVSLGSGIFGKRVL